MRELRTARALSGQDFRRTWRSPSRWTSWLPWWRTSLIANTRTASQLEKTPNAVRMSRGSGRREASCRLFLSASDLRSRGRNAAGLTHTSERKTKMSKAKTEKKVIDRKTSLARLPTLSTQTLQEVAGGRGYLTY